MNHGERNEIQAGRSSKPQGDAGLHRAMYDHRQETRRGVPAGHEQSTAGKAASRRTSPGTIYGGTIPKLVGRPGSIYEFECKADNNSTIFGNTRRWVGFLDDDPRVVEWQAKHDAFFAAQEVERQEKKGKNTNLIQRQLAPLKVAYGHMVGHQRAAFLAQIIGYVTGRVTKADLQWADEAGDDD